MKRESFVLVQFTDGHTEVFPHADADVFSEGTLTVTIGDVEHFYADSTWRTATAYDALGYPLYTRIGQPVTARVEREMSARVRRLVDDMRLEHIARVLRVFYEAPISASSLQPVLDLAVELNQGLKVRR